MPQRKISTYHYTTPMYPGQKPGSFPIYSEHEVPLRSGALSISALHTEEKVRILGTALGKPEHLGSGRFRVEHGELSTREKAMVRKLLSASLGLEKKKVVFGHEGLKYQGGHSEESWEEPWTV